MNDPKPTPLDQADARQAVQRIDQMQPVQQEPRDLLQLAVEKGASVDTLERLMTVRRELRAEAAKEAFDSAMALFQSRCPVIKKGKAVMNKESKGGGLRYKYAPLDQIVAQVKATLQEHGFSYTIDAEVDQNGVKALCKVTHRQGHSQVSAFRVPIDPEAYMNNQQRFASALTFAKRYAFVNAFGILTGDQDDDGAGAGAGAGKSVVALKKELWELLVPVRGADRTWQTARQWLVDECCLDPDTPVQELTADALEVVIDKARAKLKAQRGDK